MLPPVGTSSASALRERLLGEAGLGYRLLEPLAARGGVAALDPAGVSKRDRETESRSWLPCWKLGPA